LKALGEYYNGNTVSAKKLLISILERDPDNIKSQLLFKQLKKVEKFKDAGND
jgi:hypothetical protein